MEIRSHGHSNATVIAYYLGDLGFPESCLSGSFSSRSLPTPHWANDSLSFVPMWSPEFILYTFHVF